MQQNKFPNIARARCWRKKPRCDREHGVHCRFSGEFSANKSSTVFFTRRMANREVADAVRVQSLVVRIIKHVHRGQTRASFIRDIETREGRKEERKREREAAEK